MIVKRFSKNWVGRAVFGCLFGMITVLAPLGLGQAAYAEPETEADVPAVVEGENAEPAPEGAEQTTQTMENNSEAVVGGASCDDSLGSLGWLVCPMTGKISEAVDWLYDRIESVLTINPVQMKDGEPIYEVWKYFRGVTNIVFIIFLLIMIYSQITGMGISNYGLKRALPKLIIAAVLVNLSFVVCSLAVDASNVIGSSLRGMFSGIGEATIGSMNIGAAESGYAMADMYAAMSAGTGLTVGGGVIAFESGAIWMLIPTVLGAIVSVAIGLITIALRQALVTLLIMVAPLAIVAYILPNTEDLFKRWRKLLTRMLVFYPMFSLLFGAANLAGFAIIASAKDGFGLLLGVAVQIFPLFFSWSLMRMSGTVLGTVNERLRGLAARPLAANRSWAESHREATRQKNLAANNTYMPSLRLRQYLSDRKIHREEETAENATIVKNRGLAYNARRHYKDYNKGVLNEEGVNAYADQARNMEYARVAQRHKNNMNEGFAARVQKGTALHDRLSALDTANVNASDYLKAETARGEMIDYRNAVGFHNRMEAAVNAHMDDKDGYVYDERLGRMVKRGDYEFHFERGSGAYNVAMNRYRDIANIMSGNEQDAQYAAAYAAHAYDTQAKIITNKFQKYFELTPPTRDVRYRLEEFSRFARQVEDGTFIGRAVDHIDPIISGLRILNQRGDTDFVKDILDDLLDEKYGGLTLGTHASQAVAGFLMFDVKDNDPYLRRFGKYINLETARVYDRNDRQKATVDYEEYVKGYHTEPDGTIMYAKKDMVKLMEGTSLDGIERTALDNYDKSLRKAYTDENGKLDLEAYEQKRKEVDAATAPQFISANLKYLSGSEQITSAVKSKTGYIAKQDKTTGKYAMKPIWEDEADALFNAYETPEDKKEAQDGLEKWYRNQTLQYLKDQTPAQILGLRSDYKEPLLEHLSKSYLEDAGRKAEHDEKMAEIDRRYADMTPAEAEALKKRDREKLRMNEAGEAFRELLHAKGKLEQIEKSKRSGAANNAKDWVRELLLLDGKDELRTWILKHDYQSDVSSDGVAGDSAAGAEPTTGSGPVSGGANPDTGTVAREANGELRVRRASSSEPNPTPEEIERREALQRAKAEQRRQMQEQIRKMLAELEERKKQESDAVLTPDQQNVSVYDAEAVSAFQGEVERLWYDVRDNGDDYDDFYEISHDFVMQVLTPESYVVKAYEKYYQENPDGDSYDLREKLNELLETLLEG